MAVGAVHRPALIVLLGLVAAAVLASLAGLLRTGEPMRVGASVLLPASLLVICIAQTIPLPAGLRRAIDPAGSALLSEVAHDLQWAPLSLDPPSTARELGKAAAVLAVFLLSYHFGAGRRAPRRVIYTVAAAGIAALFVGLGHAALGEQSVYGVFKTGTTPLVLGPFINPNHSAEFLELASFSCLALALLARRRRTGWAWLVAAAALAAGAVATLSRGSLVALAAGGLAFSVLGSRGAGDPILEQQRALGWKRVLIGTTFGAIVLAGALGAGALIDEVATTDVKREVKPLLWADAISVLRAHPAGIGRGAFEYVYPVYEDPQALKVGPSTLRFAFVENGPLQLVIDTGWWGAALMIFAAIVLIREIARAGLPRPEAALVSGAIAVLAHNLADFGLEVSGVAVPFAAILGTALGRVRRENPRPARWGTVAPVLSMAGLVAGVVLLLLPTARDFDLELRRATTPESQLGLAMEAQRAHRLDYYYVLVEAMGLPLREGTRSPRLTALNRALRLCPACSAVQTQVAAALWQTGYRNQAVAQLREMIRKDTSVEHSALRFAIAELNRHHASPEEIASLEVGDAGTTIAIAEALAQRKAFSIALNLLARIPVEGVSSDDYFGAKYRAEIGLDDHGAVDRTLRTWQSKRPNSPRLFLARADLARRTNQLDEAAALLEAGAKANPADLDLVIGRAALAIERKRWAEAARAVDDMRRVSMEINRSSLDAFVWGARLEYAMGHITAALSQYEAAAAQSPDNKYVWMELGTVARGAGQMEAATRAFSRVLDLEPGHRGAKDGLEGLAQQRRKLQNGVPGSQP